jgi:hypothetical protein
MQFLVPDFMLSDKASEVQQNANSLVRDLIKLQSGTAVSEKEADAKLKERGMGPSSKASSFKRGLRLLRQELAAAVKNKEAGFRPEVRDIYKSNGGVGHEDVLGIGKKPAGGGGSAPGGMMTFDEWKKSKGGQ